MWPHIYSIYCINDPNKIYNGYPNNNNILYIYIFLQHVQAYKVKMWKYKYNIYTVCCMHTSYCMFMHDT